MSLDGLSYSSRGRASRFGQLNSLSISCWGKVPNTIIFQIVLNLDVVLEIDSDVLRVFDIDTVACRDFLIVARTDDGTNLLGFELGSETMRNIGLKTQVVRTTDIEFIVERDYKT